MRVLTLVNQKGGLVNASAHLAAQTIVDEDGNRLFEDTQIGELGKKSAVALSRVIQVAQRLNAVTNADLKDLEKN